MTAVSTAIVYCDTCSATSSELVTAATASEARTTLRTRGWQVGLARPDTDRRLDFCPQHQQPRS